MADSNSTTQRSNSTFVYSSTVSLAVIVVMTVIFLFTHKESLNNFTTLFWIVMPIVIYIVGVGLNLMGQYSSCGSVNIGKGFLSALTTLASTYAFMGISRVAVLRVPIGSIFSSYFATKQELNNDTFENIESKYPILEGISVAYYMFWGTMFGQIISSGLSAGCM